MGACPLVDGLTGEAERLPDLVPKRAAVSFYPLVRGEDRSVVACGVADFGGIAAGVGAASRAAKAVGVRSVCPRKKRPKLAGSVKPR